MPENGYNCLLFLTKNSCFHERGRGNYSLGFSQKIYCSFLVWKVVDFIRRAVIRGGGIILCFRVFISVYPVCEFLYKPKWYIFSRQKNILGSHNAVPRLTFLISGSFCGYTGIYEVCLIFLCWLKFNLFTEKLQFWKIR